MVTAHTSVGKAVIEKYAISTALNQGKKVIFTAPIKALSNQKFSNFTKKFGNKVGIMIGDNIKNMDHPTLVVTTEILRDMLLYRSPILKDVLYVIHDECHFLGNEVRGHV